MFLVVGLTLLGAYLLVAAAFFGLQERLVWYPARALPVTPAALRLPFEEAALTASDGVALHGWFIPAADARGAVLVCNGNAGNISGRLEFANAFHAMGLSVLLFDYRGYGGSGGTPSEEGSYRDAEAACDWLANRMAALDPARRIVAFGESLGGAVAVELARRRTLAGLITQSTFASIPDVGAELYRWLPVRLLARIHYASIEKVAGVRCPWLLLHSRTDELIPFAHAQRLFAAATAAANGAARPPPKLVEVAGGHNDGGFLASHEGEAAVATFIDPLFGAR